MRQVQRYITDSTLPNWVLYRNELFDQVLNSKQFSIFSVFRDRQLTKASATSDNGIWVIRSRNIPRDGKSIIHIDGYDMYVNRNDIDSFEVTKYLDRDDVLLVPNMTYYPRMNTYNVHWSKLLLFFPIQALHIKLSIKLTAKIPNKNFG